MDSFKSSLSGNLNEPVVITGCVNSLWLAGMLLVLATAGAMAWRGIPGALWVLGVGTAVGLACQVLTLLEEKRRAQTAFGSWEQVFRHTSLGVIAMKADGKSIELMNPAFARMHGYSRDELKHCALDELIAPDQCAEVKRKMSLATAETGHLRFESRHLHRDGHEFPVLADMAVLRDGAGRISGQILTVFDASEQKAQESLLRQSETAIQQILENLPVGAGEQLRRSEATMRLMLENLPVGIWLADPAGNIIYRNPESQKIWGGADWGVLDNADFCEGWWADSGEKIKKEEWALTRAVEKGEASGNEVIDILCFDGSLKTILNSAVPIFNSEGLSEGVIVINQDITSARRAELALREREASLADAQAQAHLGSWTLSVLKEDMEWSDECYRIFGVPTGSPVSYRVFREHTHPDDHDRLNRHWRAALAGSAYDIEHRILVNGAIKWVRERADLEFAPDGSLLRAFGTTQDITEIKRQERELRRSQQKLRDLVAHHEKIREEERSRIAREIHDELGQQLTAMRMDTAMIQMRFGKAMPELEHYVTRMKDTIDGTIKVVRNVAASLRPAALDMGLVSATEWLLMGFKERTDVQCYLDVPSEELKIDDLRATAVFRILQESLTNIARHANASHVYVTMRQEAGRLLISIRDDGVGFDPRQVRQKQTFGLMGIRERAKMFGGETRIDSEAGLGTSLHLTLPLE
ncbi:MAG: PAS domain S-box protein [Pseudomonadales bacterium]|nr:PAS domain S-box protein [Pseudomonadales bacterium]